ncbi:MAG: site-2 protease family protein [Ruminococcaceae bacterium]|nr:site-2 protease family protein [Oscillospiraceae bacterium]
MISRLQSWFSNGWMGIVNLLITVLCVFLSLSIHEFFHGYAAYKLGDGTAKYMGRLNLKPSSHLDPIGAICLFLFGFGWANPVPVNPNNFKIKSRKLGMAITSLAGPVSNLLLSFIALLLVNIMYIFVPETNSVAYSVFSVLEAVFTTLVYMNTGLAIFNLLPIPPLDGSKILNAVLPARIYFKIMQYEQYGFIILLLILNLPVFSNLLTMLQYGVIRFFIQIIELLPFF